MLDPEEGARPFQAHRDRQRLPEIAFVGSASTFSDNLVHATARHLRDLKVIRLPALEAFDAMPPRQICWLRLLVIDDVTVANASDMLLRGIGHAPTTTIALAFRNHDIAARLYRASARALPIDSYVPLNVRLDVWLSILDLLLHGGRYVPEELLAQHHGPRLRQVEQGGGGAARLGLTQRQYDVLRLASAGLPNKVIATRLGLSDHTVKLHIHNIIARLGVANRTEAAARFHDHAP